MTGDVLVDAFTRGNVEKLKKSKLQKEGEQKKTKPRKLKSRFCLYEFADVSTSKYLYDGRF